MDIQTYATAGCGAIL